jgi:MFS family permease
VQSDSLPAQAKVMGTTVGGYAWYVAIALCFAHFIAFIDRYLIGLLAEPLRESLAITDTQIGLLHGTSFVILYCVAAIPLGWVADIANRRNIIVVGILVWSIATGAAAFSDTFTALFISRLFVGIGEASLVPAGMSMIAAYFDKTRMGRAVSIFTIGALLGNGGAFILGGALLGWFTLQGGLILPGIASFEPWQGIFLVAGIAGLVIAAIFFWTVKEPLREGKGPAGDKIELSRKDAAGQDWKSHVRVFKDGFRHIRSHGKAFAVQIGANSATSAVGYAGAAWCIPLFVREYGLSVPEAGGLIGAITLIVSPLGSLAGGQFSDRLAARNATGVPLLAIGLSLMFTLPSTFIYCFAPTMTIAIAGFIVFQFFAIFAMPSVYGGVQLLSPGKYRGIVASVSLLVYTLLALGMGPPIVGFFTDRVFGGPENLPLGLAAGISCFALAGLAVCLMGRKVFQRSVITG